MNLALRGCALAALLLLAGCAIDQPARLGSAAATPLAQAQQAPYRRPADVSCGALTLQIQALQERVAALILPLVEAGQFSGAVVLTRQGRVVFERGWGLAQHAAGLAFTPDTPSDGASLAKTFTAAALWWLVHEGRVDPDAPAVRYLPEYPHAQTTVRQLLAHSNGLPAGYEFFDPHFAADQTRSTAELLRLVARHAPQPGFAPGQRFEYSNLGYDALALLIERVSGQPYADVLQQRFFARLGMQHSFVRPARLADWRGPRTLGYRWRDEAWQVVEVFDNEGFHGASNLYLPARDLSRWAAAHAAGTALPQAVAAAGQARPVIAGQASAINGLSWYCDASGQRCWYTGSLNAFHALVYWDRVRDESVVFVSNSSLPPWPVITLQRDLVDALAGQPPRAGPAPPLQRFVRATRAGIAGVYQAEGQAPISLGEEAGALWMRQGDGLVYALFQVSAEVFYAPGPDLWLAFGAGAQPDVLHLRGMFVDATLQRAAAPALPR